MKACIIQPYYSFDPSKLEECYEGMMKIIDSCDDSMDLIVLPEYCDIPAATENAEQFHQSIEKYNDAVYKKVSETANVHSLH